MSNNLPIKDKMAVVFHGIVGGMDGRNGIGTPSDISACAKTIKHNILSVYDCDVFIHSWSVNQKDEMISLYNPVEYLIQPQEHFYFSSKQIENANDDINGMEYRTISRYMSLERIMSLKQKYEINNNFRYKWVLIVRLDLIFFNKLNLSVLDNNNVYICTEPHWSSRGGLIHDIIFLSNSTLMDNFARFGREMIDGVYDSRDAHSATFLKIMNMVNNDRNRLQFGFKRYEDVEIYRLVIRTDLNPVGHAYGALETTNRFYALLKQIEDEEKL
jgi:hypothetical protein